MSNLYVDKTILADGSAADPALKFANDANSGLYRISEDKIGIATSGAKIGEIGTDYGGFKNNICNFVNVIGTTDYSGSTGTISDLTTTYTPKFSNSLLLIQAEISWFSQASGSIPGLGLYFEINGVRRRTGLNYTDRGGYIVNTTIFTFPLTLTSGNSINIATLWEPASGTPTITIYGANSTYNHYLRIWEIMK